MIAIVLALRRIRIVWLLLIVLWILSGLELVSSLTGFLLERALTVEENIAVVTVDHPNCLVLQNTATVLVVNHDTSLVSYAVVTASIVLDRHRVLDYIVASEGKQLASADLGSPGVPHNNLFRPFYLNSLCHVDEWQMLNDGVFQTERYHLAGCLVGMTAQLCPVLARVRENVWVL